MRCLGLRLAASQYHGPRRVANCAMGFGSCSHMNGSPLQVKHCSASQHQYSTKPDHIPAQPPSTIAPRRDAMRHRSRQRVHRRHHGAPRPISRPNGLCAHRQRHSAARGLDLPDQPIFSHRPAAAHAHGGRSAVGSILLQYAARALPTEGPRYAPGPRRICARLMHLGPHTPAHAHRHRAHTRRRTPKRAPRSNVGRGRTWQGRRGGVVPTLTVTPRGRARASSAQSASLNTSREHFLVPLPIAPVQSARWVTQANSKGPAGAPNRLNARDEEGPPRREKKCEGGRSVGRGVA